jgi:hypothetical protein
MPPKAGKVPQPVKKKPEMVALYRRKEVAKRYVQGQSQWEIANDLNLSETTVTGDIRTIREQWLASALQDFNSAKAMELAKIDNLEATAWEAWHRSCADQRKITTKQALKGTKAEPLSNPDPRSSRKKPPLTLEMMVVGQDTEIKNTGGNPAFLATIQWCIEVRVKILGLVQDIKINNTIINWDDVARMAATGGVPDLIEDEIMRVKVKNVNNPTTPEPNVLEDEDEDEEE